MSDKRPHNTNGRAIVRSHEHPDRHAQRRRHPRHHRRPGLRHRPRLGRRRPVHRSAGRRGRHVEERRVRAFRFARRPAARGPRRSRRAFRQRRADAGAVAAAWPAAFARDHAELVRMGAQHRRWRLRADGLGDGIRRSPRRAARPGACTTNAAGAANSRAPCRSRSTSAISHRATSSSTCSSFTPFR